MFHKFFQYFTNPEVFQADTRLGKVLLQEELSVEKKISNFRFYFFLFVFVGQIAKAVFINPAIFETIWVPLV
ncbi:MAG: hypothetical protein KDK36_03870, partial [Leptospiraceae bacterium]|nr:hypothetical protein [Leptospiraceae bacterium]